ncbi:GLPGLI family protein [Chryseobacterium hagamense]|nr:GLPGLI family protein [Chryseobacterium hagamense]
MKNLFKLFLLVFLLIGARNYAQHYKAIYKMIYKADSLDNRTLTKNMVLEIRQEQTSFCSYDFYKEDSIYQEKMKLGKEVYQPMFDSDFSIVSNHDKLTVSKFFNFPPNSTIYRLDENEKKFSWEILKETKKINHYICQKAQLKYKGRKWTAWFTKEIPLNFGPYIFEGLPGPILYMEDSRKNYTFELLSLKNTDPADHSLFNNLNAIPISGKEYQKICLDRYHDPYKEMRNDGAFIESSSGELKKPNINEMTRTKQKFIKSHNNPIELSEAVKYP